MNFLNIVELIGTISEILQILKKFTFSGLKSDVLKKERINYINIGNVYGSVKEVFQIFNFMVCGPGSLNFFVKVVADILRENGKCNFLRSLIDLFIIIIIFFLQIFSKLIGGCSRKLLFLF